ncbi:MAG TPA: ABC transporter ATP-binding protein [Xanthobacteraceae bacterium]|nr:ABC transporter ATP-binding protein [Xanthobacteraceae bacterium]
MSDVTLQDVSRLYGTKAAVKTLSLVVPDGSFVSLLGPSGCGKTTTLAMIAGLDRPTGGRISIGGTLVADGAAGYMMLPEARNLGLVPQSYALWPHMRVSQNVGFPLKVRKMPAAQRQQRIAEALALVEIGHLADRYPHELSGGQQQRVAIARTLAYRPKVLLLDEPLSNLDAKLRERARHWLRSLQRELKMTTIFVTHDQGEALSLSDHVAVLDGGELAQYGTPEDIYLRPATPFVADFIGGCSFVKGAVVAKGARGQPTVRLDGGSVLALGVQDRDFAIGQTVSAAVRPEWLTVAGTHAPNVIAVKIDGLEFSGDRYNVFGTHGGHPIRFSSEKRIDGEVGLACDVDRIVLFSADAIGRCGPEAAPKP